MSCWSVKNINSTLLAFLMILLTSCAAPNSPVPQTLIEAQTLTPTPTPKLTNTTVPTSTQIPGFEDWSVLNAQAVDIAVENGSLILTLKRRVLWFMNDRGVLIYRLTTGNFKISAEVHTAKKSDPLQPPGGDGTVQLGGLMARNGNGGLENYVFIVVGDDGDGLSVESKNTLDSLSKYKGPSWGSAEAELRLCRSGLAFKVYKRHVGKNEAWILVDSFDRPDLPETLQVGVNIYTDSAPDLQVRFDHLKIESISGEADCEED